MEDKDELQPKEANTEQTEAAGEEQPVVAEARGNPEASAETEHPELNRAGEPEQLQHSESDRAGEPEQKPEQQ